MNKSIFSKDITLKIILIVLGTFFVLVILYGSLQIFRGKGINLESQDPNIVHTIDVPYQNFEPSEDKQEPENFQKQELTGVVAVNPKTGWKIYRNKEYGFEIQYPPHWDVSEHGLYDYTGQKSFLPFVSFGEYPDSNSTMQLSIMENPDNLNSTDYVNKLIKEAENEFKEGRAPHPYYYNAIKQAKVNGIQAVELDGVFVIDGSQERIFITHGNRAYGFYFPVAEENPNYSNPVEGNKISHQMLGTFRFID